MTPVRPFGGADFLMLLVVIGAAAGARAGYMMNCADNGNSPGPLVVQDAQPPLAGLPADTELRGQKDPTELQALANNLKEHHWFGSLAPFAPAEEQTAHVAPGYPWLLSLADRYAEPVVADRRVRWVQVGLGALTAGLYFLFARRAFNSRMAATLAGLLCAVYPFWVINTAAIDDGVLASFLLAAILFLGARAAQTSGPFASLLYGLALAGLALVRAATLPFAFVALGWFLLYSRRLHRGWVCALVAFLGFGTGIAPWTVRNYRLFHEPLPVVSSLHLHLWLGNNPRATGGPASDAISEGAPTDELAAIKNQAARYDRLGPIWWQTVREQPLATVQRRMWAALYFVFGETWFKENRLAEERATDGQPMPTWLAANYALILAASLLAILVFGLLGWRWTYGWAEQAMPSSLALIWIPLPYVLGHAEALHGPRLPLDGVLLCYAAFALACCIPGVGGQLLRGARGQRSEGDS